MPGALALAHPKHPNMIQALVEKFIKNPGNLRMGSNKLARRWGVSPEEVREARSVARATLHGDEQIGTGSEDEVIHKVNNEKGTLESTTTSNWEAKTDEELAKLHRVDLTKYKISSYWSKIKASGKFTSSVFCTLRKVDNDAELQLDLLKEAIEASLEVVRPYTPPTVRSTNHRALLVITSDEHVAAANLEDDLYDIPYDKTQYLLRKARILDEIRKELDGAACENFIEIKLGDDLDGWNGGTTRSGEPGHAHILPQNMSNKAAVETYIRVNNWYWDAIMEMGIAQSHTKYDVVNSNHGGNGLDYIANLGVQIYLEAKHPSVRIEYVHKFIGHFTYGPHNLLLTHGKDENYRKRPLPLNLDPQTEVFIKQYMDINHLPADYHNLLLKGDLHQWNWNAGKFFDYVNVGSLYGSSGWVQANFGLTKPSFVIGWLDKNSKDFNLRPIYL